MSQSSGALQDEPPSTEIFSTISSLQEAIWARRPVLAEIMKKHGGKTLFRYAQDFMDVNSAPGLDERKPELIEVVRELTEQRLGKQVADSVLRQLSKLALVSTIDHHGPIDHPFFVNANIISAIPYYESQDPDVQYLIVFSFASVSLNNASAFPRGIEFHGGVNGSGNLIRLPILPDRLKMGVVYGMRSFDRSDLTKAEAELVKKEKNGEILAGKGSQIRDLMEEYFGATDVLAAPDLVAQITKINFRLWPKFFHPIQKKKMPDLIYLDIETLVTELLLRHHFGNPASLLYRLIFDADFRPLITKYFDNLAGGFSIQAGWGTYLFWATDEKNHRVQLSLNTGPHRGGASVLYSKHRGYNFEITPEGLEKALREKKIFPSMLLCYLVVSLYYGMKCLGGFCQVHDLTMIKEAWGALLREVGEDLEAEAILPIQTKELGGDGPVLAYLKTLKGDLVPATGIDMMLKGEDTSYESFVELSQKVTLSEMMNPMLPEIYTVLYSSFQRNPELLKITPEQILRETGLQKKLMQ